VFVCILPEKAVLEMTYTVSGRTLHPTHSLTVDTVKYIGDRSFMAAVLLRLWNNMPVKLGQRNITFKHMY